MYNLFVTADDSAWRGKPVEFDRTRCLREYTADDLSAKYRNLTESDCKFLISLPCLFAFESGCGKSARIGRLLKVEQKDGRVRVLYEIPKNALKLKPKRMASLETSPKLLRT